MTPPSLSAEAAPSADASTDEIAITNPGYAEYLRSNEGREIVRLVAERDALRSQVESLKGTNTRLNRRCQEAESALPDYKRMLAVPPDGDGFRFVSGNLGRALLATQCARLAERVEALALLVGEHNAACQDRCGHGEQEAVRCKYRPYFENNGRRCTECPVHEQIEVPEALQPLVSAAIARDGT